MKTSNTEYSVWKYNTRHGGHKFIRACCFAGHIIISQLYFGRSKTIMYRYVASLYLYSVNHYNSRIFTDLFSLNIPFIRHIRASGRVVNAFRNGHVSVRNRTYSPQKGKSPVSLSVAALAEGRVTSHSVSVLAEGIVTCQSGTGPLSQRSANAKVRYRKSPLSQRSRVRVRVG